MTKKDIRKEVYARRSMLKEEEFRMLNDNLHSNIKEFFNRLDEYKNSKTLFMYSSYGKEADTNKLFDIFRYDGKQIAFPKVTIPENRQMNFVVVTDIKELSAGYKGIPEPIGNCYCDEISQEAIIVVPMVAFSKEGARVGYGGGYYDKFLSKYKFRKIIGIAFEFQRFDDIEKEEHDIKLDYIVTEKKIYGGLYE